MLECAPDGLGHRRRRPRQGAAHHEQVGVYKNSVEHKYSYTGVQYKCPAYGWSSTKDHIGIWFINPTIEYLSGGATKHGTGLPLRRQRQPDPDHPRLLERQPLRRLAAATSPPAKTGARSSARSSSTSIRWPASRRPSPADLATLAATAGNPTVPPAWKDNATALFQDALAQAKIGKRQMALRLGQRRGLPAQDERGNVTGQLVLNDPLAPTHLDQAAPPDRRPGLPRFRPA